MAKGKQFARPGKAPKAKAIEPQTPDEFQEAADKEEETGGKWRAGDPAKSGRAFLRALEVYDPRPALWNEFAARAICGCSPSAKTMRLGPART